MRKGIVYDAKPFYLWFVAVFLATIFVPVISKMQVDRYYILFSVCLVYFIGFFSVKKFSFNQDVFYRCYPLRFLKFLSLRRFDYSELKVVEIRQRKEPYQRPYVILHFSEGRKMKSKFFSHRAFIFNSVESLLPLLKCLIGNRIPIKLNMTSEYKNDYKLLREYIDNSNGQHYR